MLLVSITHCPLGPANPLLCLTGKRGFCIIQPPSCASSLVPSSPARGTWQLQSDWELPGFKIKAQVCETALWKQQHASDPGQHQQSVLLERNWKKMHKSHLPLLNVSYLNKIKATSDQGKTTGYFIYWWQRKRKLTFWQYLEVLQSYLPAAVYSFLFFTQTSLCKSSFLLNVLSP